MFPCYCAHLFICLPPPILVLLFWIPPDWKTRPFQCLTVSMGTALSNAVIIPFVVVAIVTGQDKVIRWLVSTLNYPYLEANTWEQDKTINCFFLWSPNRFKIHSKSDPSTGNDVYLRVHPSHRVPNWTKFSEKIFYMRHFRFCQPPKSNKMH